MLMQRVTKYLDKAHVDYHSESHPLAYTAQQIAQQSHLSGMSFCKTVMVVVDSKLSMIVIPAPYTIDFYNIAAAIGAQRVDLAYEHQFRDVFPDCETGAMPPFGNLFDVPVYMHDSLIEPDLISFNAGNHRELLQMKSMDFIELVNPMMISKGVISSGIGYEHEHSRQGVQRH